MRFEKNRGVFVRELDIAEAEQNYVVRGALEALAGRILAARITDDEVAELRGLIVQMEDADGNVRAHTGDGSMRVVGRFDAVDLTSGDGRVSLTVREGSRVQRAWDVRTSDGSVNVEIPANLSADLDLHTGDGHIDLDMPVTTEGKIRTNEVRGKLNGGGSLLTIHTGDGSIHLRRS